MEKLKIWLQTLERDNQPEYPYDRVFHQEDTVRWSINEPNLQNQLEWVQSTHCITGNFIIRLFILLYNYYYNYYNYYNYSNYYNYYVGYDWFDLTMVIRTLADLIHMPVCICALPTPHLDTEVALVVDTPRTRSWYCKGCQSIFLSTSFTNRQSWFNPQYVKTGQELLQTLWCLDEDYLLRRHSDALWWTYYDLVDEELRIGGKIESLREVLGADKYQ